MKLPLICSLCLAGFSLAAEPVTFPMEVGTLKTVGAGSRTYDGVKVVSKDAVGIKIMHEGGTSRIAYEKLPQDLRQRFAVDPEAAKAQLRKEAEQNAAHDRAVGDGIQTPGQGGGGASMPEAANPQVPDDADGDSDEAFIQRILMDSMPDGTGKTRMERIDAMKGYIERLHQQIAKLDAEILLRDERASRRAFRRAERGSVSLGRASVTAEHQAYNEARKTLHQKVKEAGLQLDELEGK